MITETATTTTEAPILQDGEIYFIPEDNRYYRVDFCVSQGEWATVRIPECDSSKRRHAVVTTEMKRVKGVLVERIIKQQVAATNKMERRPVRFENDYLPGAVRRGEAVKVTS